MRINMLISAILSFSFLTACASCSKGEENNEAVAIYDLQGHQVTKGQMKRGIYIVKAKDRTYKMVFR